MKVRDIMTTPVTTLEPTDSLAFAEELMNVERVRHLPVVEGDVLVGLLSHRDVLAASISALGNPSEEDDLEAKRKVQIQQIMRGSVETVGPDEDAIGAADILLQQKVGCLPVVDERARLIGILTESDFVRLARHGLATGQMAPRSPVVPARGRVSDAEEEMHEQEGRAKKVTAAPPTQVGASRRAQSGGRAKVKKAIKKTAKEAVRGRVRR